MLLFFYNMNEIGQYTKEEFESFAIGIKKAIDIIKSKKPDYIFAPIVGSVPLIDVMSIIDRHFPTEIVEYPPNSSRFRDREKIMNEWYKNFLESNYNNKKMKIVCIDEVISGGSAVKGYTEFYKTLYQLGKEKKENLEKKISYEIVGIGEQPQNGKRNKGILSLIKNKKAYVIEVKKIITSDNILLNPIRLKIEKETQNGRFIFKPEIEKFEYTDEYINLLRDIANYFGRDPEKIEIKNTLKIKESIEKYLKY